MQAIDKIVSAEQIPLSSKVVRNVALSGARLLLVIPVQLLLIPFIVGKVGTRGYGTWAVFLAITNLSSLADLGLAGTLTKHVAEHYAHRDTSALNRLIDTGTVLYAGLGLTAFLFLTLANPFLTGVLFKGSSTPPHELRVLWMWASLLVVANLLNIPFYSVLGGLQRMDLSNFLVYLRVLLGAVLTVVFLHWGWDLRGLLWANLIAVGLVLGVNSWMIRKLLPALRALRFDFDRQEVRRIFSFSVKMYVTQIAVAIDTQFNKLFLSVFTGVQATGWYSIASETAWRIRSLPELLLSPVMAAASELDARGEAAKLQQLYIRAHKYLALLGVPLVLFIVYIAKRAIPLWLGQNLSIVATPLWIITAATFLNLLSGPGYLILIGRGRLEPGMKSALFSVILNLCLGGFLTYFYGFWGAVSVTAFSVIAGAAYFIYLFDRETEQTFWVVLSRAYLKPVTCCAVWFVVFSILFPVNNSGWGGLVIRGSLYAVAYLLSLVLCRFFDEFDIATAESLLPATRHFRRLIPVA